MICYGDRTFCASENCTGKCGRQLTDEVREDAEKCGLMLSLGKFCDEPDEPKRPAETGGSD